MSSSAVVIENQKFAGNYFSLTINDQGVGSLVFDYPNEKVNKLSEDSLLELSSVLDAIAGRSDIKVLIFKSGKADNFIAGADITQIQEISSPEDAAIKSAKGQQIIHQIAKLKMPTIAVIHGACVGGGLELVLACRYRIASDHHKTLLGLPEVQLGIIPGFGGTQRLPRLIGLVAGLTLIVQGKMLPALKALKLHVVDQVYATEFFDEKVAAFVQEVLQKGKHKASLMARKKKIVNTFIELPVLKEMVFKKTIQEVMKKSKGQYPALLKAIEVVQKSFSLSIEEGLKVESRGFGEVACTDVCRNLIEFFFTTEAIKKENGLPQGETFEPIAMKQIGVLGAGIMGGGIAWLASHKGYMVRLKDVSWDAIAMGYRSCKEIYDQLLKIKKLKKSEVTLRMSRISGSLQYDGFDRCEMVIEAIVENMDVKKKVFAELEEQVSEDCILATNTSALSVNEMSADLKHPERFVGVHFFNPVNRMPLVEVIPNNKTSPAVLANTVAWVRASGKTPVVVQDCAGFLVNRILIPYVNEAIFLLEAGADITVIDYLLTKFGMPMGPFLLADNVGLDVGYKVANTLEKAYGKRMQAPGFLEEIHGMKGVLGKKSGKGFYIHQGKQSDVINQSLLSQLQTYREVNRIQTRVITDEECLDRITLCLVNEASRCLEEGIISNARFLDLAMVFGTGYPPFRGGVLRYADQLGLPLVLDKIKKYYHQEGERFKPSAKIEQLAKENGTFY